MVLVYKNLQNWLIFRVNRAKGAAAMASNMGWAGYCWKTSQILQRMFTYIYNIRWYQWKRNAHLYIYIFIGTNGRGKKNTYIDLEPISRENSMYSMISRLMMLRTAPRADPDEFSQNRRPLNQLKRPDYWWYHTCSWLITFCSFESCLIKNKYSFHQHDYQIPSEFVDDLNMFTLWPPKIAKLVYKLR